MIVATLPFAFSGTAPFLVLGALMTGGTWSSGALQTALLQRPGRLRTLAGQVLALLVVVAVAVLVTFVVIGGFSLAVARAQTGSWSPEISPFPAVSVVARGAGVCLLVPLTYAAAGLLLGLLLRNASAAVAVALLWSVVLEGLLDVVALQAGGVFQVINDALPGASAVSLGSWFGAVGGGPGTQMYFRVAPATAVWVLAGYLCGFVLAAAVLLMCRDVAAATSTSRPHAEHRKAQARLRDGEERSPRRLLPAPRWSASVRAELLVLRKRPVAWALLLTTPFFTLVTGYGLNYLFYVTAGTGVSQGVSPSLPTLLPGEFVARALSNFGFNDVGVDTSAAFLLLGALVAGSDWSRRTITTSTVQGPTRLETFLGQAAALVLLLALSAAATFVLAATASMAIAQREFGLAWTGMSPLPAAGVVAQGLAAAVLISVAFALAGLALGTATRSSSGAIGAVLVWVIVVQRQLDTLATQVGGVVQTFTNLLPNTSQATLTQLFGSVSPYSTATDLPVQASVAVGLLAAYSVAFLLIPAYLLQRRDLA